MAPATPPAPVDRLRLGQAGPGKRTPVVFLHVAARASATFFPSSPRILHGLEPSLIVLQNGTAACQRAQPARSAYAHSGSSVKTCPIRSPSTTWTRSLQDGFW